eukprot:SAG31_NODE_752_length_12351_cov_14.467516_3_plen_226_part_00
MQQLAQKSVRADHVASFDPVLSLMLIRAAQRFGGKFMLTMNMAGSALSLMVAPRMARQGFWSLVACFFVMGACQGPLMPAKTAMQQTWLPKGVERVWATRFMSLGTRMAQLAAVAITPRIVTSYGWQWVPHIYGSVTGAVMLVWQLFAADAPSAIRETGDGEKNGKTDSAAKTVEWRIFQVTILHFGTHLRRTCHSNPCFACRKCTMPLGTRYGMLISAFHVRGR